MDTYNAETRSRVMRAVKSKDTKPEMLVRRALHKAGYRYRLHRKDLPGKPDLTFPGRRKIIFVHGCLWHQHADCRHASRPASNREYWDAKLDRNVARDRRSINALHDMEWDCLTVWECETKNMDALLKRISYFLGER